MAGAQIDGIADRVALVTGAAGNFGRTVAVALVEAGAGVVLADRREAEEGLEVSAALCAEAAPAATVVTATFDVTDPAAVEAELGSVAATTGPIRLLVNNAGYQGVFAGIRDYPLDDLRLVLDVNVVGVFAVLQAVARQMIDAGGGAVVNVGSMAGVSGAVNMPAYSASKAAVAGLTRAAAKDLAAFGIRVNTVSPGFIGPGVMWDRQVAGQASTPSAVYGDDVHTVAAQMIGSVPLGRYGSLDEVASAILFLLSDAAGFVTGFELELSGGGR